MCYDSLYAKNATIPLTRLAFLSILTGVVAATLSFWHELADPRAAKPEYRHFSIPHGLGEAAVSGAGVTSTIDAGLHFLQRRWHAMQFQGTPRVRSTITLLPLTLLLGLVLGLGNAVLRQGTEPHPPPEVDILEFIVSPKRTPRTPAPPSIPDATQPLGTHR